MTEPMSDSQLAEIEAADLHSLQADAQHNPDVWTLNRWREELLSEVRQLTEDRDRARDLAVACEQQLGEIERLVYMGGQSAHSTRRSILRVFEEAKPQ